VGPVYSRNDVETRAQQLESCYRTSLNLAIENNLKHIAFPSISTGIYGYPIDDATHIALDVVRRFCESDVGNKLERVIFVVWSNKDKEVYETLIPEYFPSSDSPHEPSPSDAPATDEPSDKAAAEAPGEAAVPEAPPQTSSVDTDMKGPKAP